MAKGLTAAQGFTVGLIAGVALIMVIVFVAVLILANSVTDSGSGKSSPSPAPLTVNQAPPAPLPARPSAPSACENDVMAYNMAKQFVLQRIKTPSTAKFPWAGDGGVIRSYLGSCTHEIGGYFDAQNTFGAMIRSRYRAKIQKVDEDNWKVLELVIN